MQLQGILLCEAKELMIYNVNILGDSSSVLETIVNSNLGLFFSGRGDFNLNYLVIVTLSLFVSPKIAYKFQI